MITCAIALAVVLGSPPHPGVHPAPGTFPGNQAPHLRIRLHPGFALVVSLHLRWDRQVDGDVGGIWPVVTVAQVHNGPDTAQRSPAPHATRLHVIDVTQMS